MEATEITNTKDLIPKWNRTARATGEELKQFWSKLRLFYRTAELPKKQEGTTRSALIPTLTQKANQKNTLSSDGFYQLLVQVVLEYQAERRNSFKIQLTELIAGLQELLQVKEAPENELNDTYDFARELIAFDKLANMIPGSTRQSLSKERLSRLKEVAATLQEGLKQYNRQEAILINATKTDAIHTENVKWLTGDKDPFKQLFELFRKEIELFMLLIKGYRIGKLETEDAYQEEIHDQYFEQFSWHRLQKHELALFPPLVLVVNRHQVFDKLASFLQLINSNFPVNIVVLNNEVVSQPNAELSWEEAAHQNRQELAALAIAQRNTFTFQHGMYGAESLKLGLKEGIASSSSSVFNLSLPELKNKELYNTVVIAENISRFFPSIKYKPDTISFDRSANIEADEVWTSFNLEATTNEDSQVIFDVSFTYADYKAIFPEKAKELMIIPAQYYDDQYLLPLSDYLALDEDQLYGKIPYIWVVNDVNQLLRAAVPNVWVVSCQERSDYWQYLMRLGSHDIQSNSKQQGKDIQPAEKKSLSEPRINQIDQEQAVAVATQRLIAALLSDDK